MKNLTRDLLKTAKFLARKSCEDLETPDDDIMPVMLWRGRYGDGMMPMVPMSDDRDKDRIASMMTTVLAVSRANIAATITTGWMVTVPDDGTGQPELNCMPSEHPDRVECVTIICVRRDDGDSMSSAKLTRHPDRAPDLAEWETVLRHLEVDGRFGNAMHLGMHLSDGMPADLVEIIDEGWRQGRGEDLIRRFHRVFAGMKVLNDLLEKEGEAP
jgi:hypothetical protein